MSRWANDPDAAADQLIARCVDDLALEGRILVANHVGTLRDLLSERGAACEVWDRRLAGSGAATAWPPSGPFDVAMLRLPKAKDEQEMATHACLGVLAPGGRLIVYGGNDEGIRSAGSMVGRLCGEVETVAARGHGRVLVARCPPAIENLRGALADWRKVTPITIGGAVRDWVTYPGVFAAGRIDEGTALLIGALPPLAAGARLLDYGCGSGVITTAALAAQSSLNAVMLDNDAVALAAAGENVPGTRTVLGRQLADAGAATYDAILSNPPLHRGIAEDHGWLHQLIADAPRFLKAKGVLQVVVQRRVPLDQLLAKHLADAKVVAETGSFRVWRARAASRL